MEQLFNAEAEKKKNIRLALGVAGISLLGCFFIYLIFIGVMFFSPWRLFNLFPFPPLSEEVSGLHSKLLIFSKTMDFKGIAAETPPKEIMNLRVYDGKKLSDPIEIRQFSSLFAAGNKVYFFDRGLYRTFDGERWEEYKNSSIGNDPEGAVDNAGVWVLSSFKGKPVLRLITDKETKDIPLPDSGSEDKICICSSQILPAGNDLHLFWKNEGTVFWSRYNGKTWGESQTFEGTGIYKAVSFKDRIYLFGSLHSGEKSLLTLRTYDKGIWSESRVIPFVATVFDPIPAVFNDKLIIFQRGFFSSNYYFVEDTGEKVRGPVHIQRQSLLRDNKIWKLLLLGFSPGILFFIFIFLLSAFIRKFKLKTWRDDSGEYEFGSLFRRYLAKLIDSLIVTIPASAILYPAFKDGKFFEHPFRSFGLFIIFGISLILGSFLYHSLLEGLWGKTIGKKLCGIVVLSDDFTRCTIWKGFLRNLLRIIDSFFYYLVATVSLTGTMKWQRLGDIAAGTVVVRYDHKKRIQSRGGNSL